MHQGSRRKIALCGSPDWRERLALALRDHRGVVTVDAAPLSEDVLPAAVDSVLVQSAPGIATADDLAARLRRRCSRAQVIGVTREGDAAATRSVFLAGCDDCIEDTPELPAQLDRAIETHRLQRPAPAPRDERGDIDVSTGLHTYRGLVRQLAALRDRCRVEDGSACMLMFDLDRFHELVEDPADDLADLALEWFGNCLRHALRQKDLIARVHTDRYVAALPGIRMAAAREFAHRCRHVMHAHPLQRGDERIEVGVSIAIVESTAGFIESVHQLLRRARLVLEHCKLTGGNRTLSADDLDELRPKPDELTPLNIERWKHWIRRQREDLRRTVVASTRSLVAAVEAKDPHTRAHSLTVSRYAEALARRMRIGELAMDTLRSAALLHDVGKIGVPDAILTKPSSLTADEFLVIKRHPQTALEILEHASHIVDERPLILHHHERHDGTGYPSGLGGDRIPIGARVLAVADAIDAMASPRAYKHAYGIDRIRHELRAGSGRQFDPAVATVALEWLEENPLRAPSDPPEVTGE